MQTILTIISSIAIFIAGIFGINNHQQDIDKLKEEKQLIETPAPQIILGSDVTLPIAGMIYYLSGSGISSSATSLTLTSLTIPQTGQKIVDSDLSDTFYLTIEPGNRTRQEIVSCTTVTQNAAGTATLSGCLRGLSPITPYTASTTLQFSHGGGTTVIFSDAPQLFNTYTAKDNDETITGVWSFNQLPTSSLQATSSNQFAIKNYVDNVANQGAATSTTSNWGHEQRRRQQRR